MKNLFRLSSRQWWLLLVGFVATVVVYGIFVRLYGLGFPNKQVFDEVYFPVFAQHYIDGSSFYDVHPPFGKFVIAMGMLLWGDNPIGWRVMPLIFGVATIGLMASLWWTMFKDKVGALIIAFLIAIDGSLIVYSRVGLMDGILFFFTFITFLAALRLDTIWRLLWLGTLLGLAVAIKWPSLALLVPIALLFHKQKQWHGVGIVLSWAAILYFVIVVAGQVLTHVENPIQAAWDWHASAARYHADLTATHPWGSPWWSWPLGIKPVLFLYDAVSEGIQVQNNMTNPLVTWASTFVVLGTVLHMLAERIWEKRSLLKHPLLPFVLGFFAFWLPWAPVSRVLFSYHYLPAYGFALLILTYWLSKLWEKQPAIVFAILVLFFAVAVFELPIAVGWLPLTEAQLHIRTFWINSSLQ